MIKFTGRQQAAGKQAPLPGVMTREAAFDRDCANAGRRIRNAERLLVPASWLIEYGPS